MIPNKYASYVFSFILALIMSGIMSLVISLFNMGMVEGIVKIWLKAWSFGFIVALPTVLIISPLVKKLVSFLTVSEE